MTWKPGMTLDEIGSEMTKLCAEVKQIEAGSKALTEEFKNEVGLVVEELENHGEWTMVFVPEVPAEAQKLYRELDDFRQAFPQLLG